MEILAIIPARGGSKGIPRKNLKQIAGYPLIYHTIEAAKNSKYVNRLILSTEDDEISSVAFSYGVEVSKRPLELAQDETKTAPVLLNVLEQLEQKENYVPDVVVLLQATCPLRDSKRLDEAFELFFSSDCDSVFTVRPVGITHALWRQNHDGTVLGLYDYRNRPRRQDEDKHFGLYRETGETYIIKTEVLKKVKDFVGEKPIFHIPNDENTIDIDTVEDFEVAEKILLSRKKIKE